MALSIALIGGATGCGGSGQTVVIASTNVYAGTYKVTVIGTFTSSTNQVTTHSTTITYLID